MFLSGFAGLVYEVLWAEALALHFGNTAAAHAVVLGTFLGGMALGYAVLGAVSDRVENPLDFYGRLEIGIGLCGVLAPRIFAGAPGWVSILFILLPTAMMGGTLPPLVRAAVARGAGAGEGTASLYALNSAGAAVGVLAAGFWMIPAFGIDLSGSLAAIVNVSVGAAAIYFSSGAGEAAQSQTREPVSGAALTISQRRALLAAVFISGFAALCYEISWIRLLALSLGSSTYSFTVMLASFVAGIALGGALLRRCLSRLSEPLLFFGMLQMAAGAAVLLSTPLYPLLPFLFHVVGSNIPRTPEWFLPYEAIKFGFCFLAMLVPASLLGAALPLAASIESRGAGKSRLGASIGGVFGLNTVGNVLAAALAGLVLMPLLGLRGLLCGAALLNLCAGGMIIAAAASPRRMRLRKITAAGLAAAGLFAVYGGPWERRALVTGGFLYRPGAAASSAREFKDFIRGMDLLYYKDGANATVAVTRSDNITQLRINGKVDASDGGDMTTQLLLAHIPLLLRPDARDVMIVGLGSGVTAGAVLTHPVRSVAVAEISPEVVEASGFFRKVNGGALEDPRLRLAVMDARSFLSGSEARYDAIISEPSNPWMAGIADLYTREFFEIARSRLYPGGMFVQWVHTYLMRDEDLRMILRTIAAVFPDVQIWVVSHDIVITAGEKDIPVDFERARERMREKGVGRSLTSALLHRPAALFSLHAFSDDEVRRLSRWPGPINEDAYPLLEYAAPAGLFLGEQSGLLEEADRRLEPDGKQRRLLSRWRDYRGELSPADYEDIFHYHWIIKSPFAGVVLQEWVRAYPQDEIPRGFLDAFLEMAERRGLTRQADQIRGMLRGD